MKSIENQISYPQCLIDRKRFKNKYLELLDKLITLENQQRILVNELKAKDKLIAELKSFHVK